MARRLPIGFALAIAFVVGIAAARPASRTELPPLPAAIWSTFGPVAVLRGHPVPCVIAPGVTAPGCFLMLSRRLYVDDSLDRVMEWRVLKHERFHMQMRDQNIGFSDPRDEERIAHAVANFEVAEMQAGGGR